MKTADLIFERLKDWGVSIVFCMPGDGINGFIEALRTRGLLSNVGRYNCHRSSFQRSDRLDLAFVA